MSTDWPVKRRHMHSAAQKRWEKTRTLRFLVQCLCGDSWRYEDIGGNYERLIVDAFLEASSHWYKCKRQPEVWLLRAGGIDPPKGIALNWHNRQQALSAVHAELSELDSIEIPAFAERLTRAVQLLRMQ